MAVNNVWVFAQSTDGTPTSATLELLTKARDLGGTVSAFHYGGDAAGLQVHDRLVLDADLVVVHGVTEVGLEAGPAVDLLEHVEHVAGCQHGADGAEHHGRPEDAEREPRQGVERSDQ